MLNFTKVKPIVSIIFALASIHASLFAFDTPHSEGSEPEKFSNWEVVGPAGGDVRAIVVDPRDKNRLYISTLDGQIHTSSDGGRSWQLLVNLNEPELILDNLIVDSRDSNLLYASGHRHKNPGGFFRSTDGGATWKKAKELKDQPIYAMTQSQF